MGGLSGTRLGKGGLGHYDGGDLLAVGQGPLNLELDPDGKAGGGVMNLLSSDSADNRLINDAGDVLKIND